MKNALTPKEAKQKSSPLNKDAVSPISGQHDSPKRCQKRMLFILDHKVFTYIMTALTMYALFGDDFKLLLFQKSADSTFDVLTTISMAAFLFEIVVSSVAKTEEYLFSFYFWLDVIATISLIFDISWAWD